MLAGNRKQRRARERSEVRKSRRMQKAVVALSAGIAVGVGAAGGAYAETIQAQTISQNSYATVENLIAISDNLGRTQIALLAPAGSVLPEGWVPVVTSELSTPDPEQLNFLEALTQGGQLLLAVPDTSHVPGASTALSGISPQVAQGLAAIPLAGTLGSGATVYAKMASAWAQLNLINLTTAGKNFEADINESVLGKDKVAQDAGELTGIPELDDALGFWTGSRTTSNWTGTTSWLGATGTTWISQDRVTMDGTTSEQLKESFSEELNNPDALVVKNGSIERVKVGETCVWGYCVPKYDYVWVGQTNADGTQKYTTTYDPNAEVTKALAALDGIDIGGFSITQREAGGAYTGALGGKAGWLAAATQVVVPGVGGADDYVATVPLFAAGVSLPDDMFTTGMQLSPGLVTASGQSVDSVLGSRSATWSVPGLGLGVQRTSLLESGHLGPDGFAYNSGWTIATITLGDTTVPVVYSLGSVNVGPNGIGATGPSFMGVGLPGFQLGSAPSGSTSSADAISQLLGDVPTSVIVLTPEMLFQLAQIEDPSGGVLNDPIGTLEKVLSPLFTEYVTPTATQISQALADATIEAVNKGSDRLAAASTKAVELTGDLADNAERVGQDVVSPMGAAGLMSADDAAAQSSTEKSALTDVQDPQFNDVDVPMPYVGKHRADDVEPTGGSQDVGSENGDGGNGSDNGDVNSVGGGSDSAVGDDNSGSDSGAGGSDQSDGNDGGSDTGAGEGGDGAGSA